ncbi:hypothetical protein [Caudoviricetes sp.]|nr:hypothetical protein [Caudoviricetes sp.]
MAYDSKYGRVTTEFGNFGKDEVVVIFRARDRLLPKVLLYYHLFSAKIGAPKQHLFLIMETYDLVVNWQRRNKSKVVTPTSQSYFDRVKEERLD